MHINWFIDYISWQEDSIKLPLFVFEFKYTWKKIVLSNAVDQRPLTINISIESVVAKGCFNNFQTVQTVTPPCLKAS